MHLLLQNTLFQYMNYIWMLLFGLFLPPYIINNLGIHGFGIWALIMTTARYFELLDLGIETTLIKRVAEVNNKKNYTLLNELISTAYTMQITLAGCFLLIISLLLNFISTDTPYIGELTNYSYALFMAVTAGVFRNIFAVNRAILIGIQRMKISNSIEIISTIPYLLLIIYCLKSGFGINGLISCYCAMVVINGISMFIAAKKTLPELRFNLFKFNIKRLKELLTFGTKLQVSRLSQLASFHLDKLILAIFLNATYVGMYDIGSKIVTIMRNFPLIMVSAVSPAVSDLHAQGDFENIRLLYKKGYLNLIACGLPFMLFTAFFANELIFAWLGKFFADAVWTIRILSLGYFLNMASGMASVTALGLGKPELEMRTGLLTLAINPILSISFLLLFGFKGILIATSFSLSFGTIYMLRLYQALIHYTFKENLKIYLSPLLFSLLSIIIVYIFKYVFFENIFSSPAKCRYFVVSSLILYGSTYYFALRSSNHINSISSTLKLLNKYKIS